MYKNEYDKEFRDEMRFGKKTLIWLVGFCIAVSVLVWFLTRAPKVVETAFINYEEFQEMYNTCQKLNTDLGTIRVVPDADPMFAQFSKQAMVAQKKQNLSRWVEEYNAKSKMWNRAMWKSDALPYQLNVEQFSNYK